MIFKALSVLIGVMLCWNSAYGILTIAIDEGTIRGIPFAIVPFGGEANDQFFFTVDQVVRDDLARTGRFDPIPTSEYLSTPTSAQNIQFNDWQIINADYVLIGRVESIEDTTNQFRIIARLYDSFEQKQVFGVQYIATLDKVRTTAHQITNSVFENVTGEKSSFDTDILYTTTVSNTSDGKIEHALYLSDYDGYNPKILLRSEAPILSPSGSPDGTRIAYSELRESGSEIYIQTVATGERYAIEAPNGQNSAPSWSPDGERIAFSHRADGNSDIYVLSLADNRLTRVTDHRLIDTEPDWSPDGGTIIFSSNRGRDPQIYSAVAQSNAQPRRVTLDGRSNTGAQYSPSGEALIVITDQGDGNQVGIFEFSTGLTRVISSTQFDESARFSPHGDMLIHVVEGRDRYIKILSPDGRIQTRIPVAEGQVKQVDWGMSHQ